MPAITTAEFTRGLLLIAVAVVLTYANAVHNRFHFDDEHSLVENPHIRQLSEAPHFFTDPQLFSRNVGSEMYRPLVLLSYAFTYRFFAYQAPAYHLFNIAIHLFMALAVYQLYRRLGLQNAAALCGGLLFAVHPLAGEPVNYVSSRSESLAALFYIVAIWSYAGERAWAPWVAWACYLLALLGKSSAITLPAALLAYELLWDPDRRLRWRRLLPFWGLACVYIWFSRRLVQEAVVTAPVREWSEQLSTQAKALAYYAKLLFFPRPLSVEHQFFTADSWLDAAVIAALALLATLAYFIWRGRKSHREIFWLLWIGIALLPTLLVPLNVLVNERRLYLPLVAVIGASLYLLDAGLWRKGRSMIPIVLILLLAALAQQRNGVWQEEKSLWQDARDKAPLMVRPHVRLGAIYRSEGDWSASANAYAQALAIDPDHAPAHNNMGNLLRDQGASAAAEAAYRRALSLLPSYPDALLNLATLCSDQGRFAEALPLYQQAMAFGGQRLEVYNNLGTTYLKMAKYQQAEAVLRRALALRVERPGVYFNLGGALEGQGKLPAAVAAYRRAIAIDSTYARAYYNLALLNEASSNEDEAVAAYRDFLRHWRGAPLFQREAEKRLQVLLARRGVH